MSKRTKPASNDSSAAQAVIDAYGRGEDPPLRDHPAATLFELMGTRDLKKLGADIKENGLRQPIILFRDGTILDGRNRLAACLLVGVRPTFVIWQGRDEDVIAFVVSQNLKRRHLTDKQRAMVAAKLAKLGRGRPKQAGSPVFTQSSASAALDVPERSTRQAKRIIENAPANIAALAAKELSFSAAETIAKASDEEKDRFASMTDEEVLAEVKAGPKDSNAVSPLVRALNRFIGWWMKEPGEARAELIEWVRQEANVTALDTLKTIVSGPRQLGEPEAQ